MKAAAIAGYAVGAIWYMILAKPWMAASGVTVGDDGRPANSAGALPYAVAFISALLVAGMMRHIFAMADIDTVYKGTVTGLGLGLFVAAPWIVNNVMFSDRPKVLALIDGGYAALGCTAIGLVLVLAVWVDHVYRKRSQS